MKALTVLILVCLSAGTSYGQIIYKKRPAGKKPPTELTPNPNAVPTHEQMESTRRTKDRFFHATAFALTGIASAVTYSLAKEHAKDGNYKAAEKLYFASYATGGAGVTFFVLMFK